MLAQIGSIQEKYSARGLLLHYYVEVIHGGLNKTKVIKASDYSIVQRFAEIQAQEWNEKWAEITQKQAFKDAIKDGQKQAIQRTKEAQEYLDSLTNLITHTLSHDDAINWDSLKDFSEFPTSKPRKITKPTEPVLHFADAEPKITDSRFQPQISFFDKVFGKAKAKEESANIQFQQATNDWLKYKEETVQKFNQSMIEYHSLCEKIQNEHSGLLAQWEVDKEKYLKNQAEHNDKIDEHKQRYLSGEVNAIIDYNDLVLSLSHYPDCFSKEFDLEYIQETKTLLVEYRLPYIDDLPTLKEVKFIQSREEFQEKHISQAELNRLFDEVIYQTTLRTIHEIFEADVINALDSIVFNGRVKYIDKSSGHETSACIVSIQASKDEFLGINLGNVEAKACFKNLKGVASSKLHGISPIPPIMNMRREDGRFVSAQEIANTLNDSTNLAAMDWQDFEHLIREIFEKEFSSNGGEVKITQASRDGGVDAVAFDPDPIRGGKIVIQAKRYTNTVTVSAVRDLYGTVMNEGATKGILVTTSDYGPDAYSFIKDKPLVLLNGANLLHLLDKHGHKARIDIQEARLING